MAFRRRFGAGDILSPAGPSAGDQSTGAWYRRTAASSLYERLCLLILLSEPLSQRLSFLGVGVIFLRSFLSLKHWALCGAVLCEMMEKACT